MVALSWPSNKENGMSATDRTAADVPIQLTPVILIGCARPDIDVLDRLRICYASLIPSNDRTINALTSEHANAPLLDLAMPDALKARVAPDVAAALDGPSKTLYRMIGQRLAPPVGNGVVSYVTVLDRAQAGLDAGTVVFVRKSDALTEQYVFPFLRVDLATGSHGAVGLSDLAPTRRARRAVELAEEASLADTTPGGVKSGVSLLLAISPFLPPPWGVAATGLLTVFNMLLDRSDKSPYETLKQQMEEFQIADDLKNLGRAPLTNASTQLDNMLAALTTKVEDLKTISGDVATLWAYIDGDSAQYIDAQHPITYFLGTGLATVNAANAFLWETLKTQDDTNFDATMGVFVSGVTLQLLMYKLSVQLRALAARTHQLDNNASAFDKQTETWTGQLRRIAIDIGVDPDTGKVTTKAPVDMGPDDITQGLASDAWLPRLHAWFAQTRSKRLGLISPAIYRTTLYISEGRVDGSTGGRWACEVRDGVWTWKDSRVPGDGFIPDGGEKQNCVPDTNDGSCCAANIEHKDEAQKNFDAYVNKIKTDLDTAFKPHLDTVDAWATFISNFHELLPASPPAATLTVAALTGGAAAGSNGAWVKGNVLRYAVATVDTKGPSTKGPWSPDFTVGDTAGAVISGLRAPPGTDSLWLYRQVRRPGVDWLKADDAIILNIISPDSGSKTFPTTYTDTDPG